MVFRPLTSLCSYHVLESLKDGVKFTNRDLNNEAEELQRLKSQYDIFQKDLMKQVHDITFSFLEVFEDASNLITELDILCSFALASIKAHVPYSRPKMQKSDYGILSIKGGRHPLVEIQENVYFIQNDCHMVLGESWFQFITGPNMGGASGSSFSLFIVFQANLHLSDK